MATAARSPPGCRVPELFAASNESARMRVRCLACMLAFAMFLPAATAHAQDNYEIQVYGSDLVPTGLTMVELHSNFTFSGSTGIEQGVLPTNHALHETLEITHGFSDWFEVGFYVFTSARTGSGWQWVGDHVRPRIAIPEKWHWPVGLSLSQEIGYQRSAYSPDTWTWEIRPIIDQHLGRWYWSFNPSRCELVERIRVLAQRAGDVRLQPDDHRRAGVLWRIRAPVRVRPHCAHRAATVPVDQCEFRSQMGVQHRRRIRPDQCDRRTDREDDCWISDMKCVRCMARCQ